MMCRWLGEHKVNVKSESELDIGGRETCLHSKSEPKILCLVYLSLSLLDFNNRLSD